jgi:hypothetical protein
VNDGVVVQLDFEVFHEEDIAWDDVPVADAFFLQACGSGDDAMRNVPELVFRISEACDAALVEFFFEIGGCVLEYESDVLVVFGLERVMAFLICEHVAIVGIV